MEEQLILKIILRDGELVVEGGGNNNFPPLMLVGLLEKVKTDILFDIESNHTSTVTGAVNTGKTYDA
jgi:hypothetical protein